MPILESHYVLSLRCDEPHYCCSSTFYGGSLGDAKKHARKAGWKIRANKAVLCPMCARAEAAKRKRKKIERKKKNVDNQRTN